MMRHLLVLTLLAPLTTAIGCTVTKNHTVPSYKTYNPYCGSYCTKMTFGNPSSTQMGLYGTGSEWSQGDLFICGDDERSDTFTKGRFYGGDNVKIQSCSWDNCTDDANLDKYIECGYAPTANVYPDDLPTPTNTMLCKTNKCFKLSAKRPGRFVVGNTVYEYIAGDYYDCGDKFCSGSLFPGQDNSAQFTCCEGNRCNLNEQQLSSASTLLPTSILISILGVKLFA